MLHAALVFGRASANADAGRAVRLPLLMLSNDCLVLEKMDIAVFHAGRSQDQEGQPGRA
jgi:hypothetical protein